MRTCTDEWSNLEVRFSVTSTGYTGSSLKRPLSMTIKAENRKRLKDERVECLKNSCQAYKLSILDVWFLLL